MLEEKISETVIVENKENQDNIDIDGTDKNIKR